MTHEPTPAGIRCPVCATALAGDSYGGILILPFAALLGEAVLRVFFQAVAPWTGVAFLASFVLAVPMGRLRATRATEGHAAGLATVACLAAVGYAVLDAFHDSAVQVATMQNRLLASSKGNG